MFFQNLLDGWVVGETQDITIHTTDGGISWTNVTIGGGNDILFSDSHDGIIVDRSDIKITTDGGETWAQQPIVTNQYLLAAYIIENNYWTAGTKGAILFSDNPVVTNVEFETNADEYPNEYRLFQNFPNPFNPRTNIKYAIDIKQFVSLKVYDILGREVATLVNEEKSHGEYEVEFDGSGLSSGIYLYRLVVGDFAITKKLVFIK